MSKALDYCAREGRACWLYAVDDRLTGPEQMSVTDQSARAR